MQETVHIQTPDGVMLVGDLSRPIGSKACAILLHMMPADRKSWSVLQHELESQGVASLAIDLRGHGESRKQGGRALDYRSFNDEGHQAYRVDAGTALDWMRNRGCDQVAFVGASIGANVSLEIAAYDSSIRAVALLSPGEDYRGIKTLESAKRLASSQALLSVASEGDDDESFQAAKTIIELAPSSDKTFLPYTSAGHGTNIFLQDHALPKKIADWLKAHLS